METIFHKYGGVETYVHQLAKNFANKGHRVFVISMSKNSHTSFTADGINYIMIPIKTINIPHIPKYPLQMLMFNIKAAITAAKLNQTYKLDVVHAQFCCGFFYAILKTFLRDNTKFVVTLHGTLVDEQLAHILPIFLNESGRKRFKISALLKSLKICTSFFPLIIMEYISVKHAEGIIASSHDTLKKATKYYGIEKKKTTVIYSGIDSERFSIEREPNLKQQSPWHNTFNVIYVGRADERKGIKLLIDAASTLTSKHQNVRFFLVGPDTEKYSSHIIEKNLQKFFILAGKVSQETLTKYYLISDIFVLPSLYEGFGLVVLEAFAAGKPVIAFNIASLPELIENGKNGFLVNAFNSEKFAASIETLIKNHSLLKKMSSHAKETAKRFTWLSTSNRILDFYNYLQKTATVN
jgi:glycosyltransferase involved in cell wall biosynthesis